MQTNHICADIRRQVSKHQTKIAVYDKNKAAKKWEGISWNQIGIRTNLIAKALIKSEVHEFDNVGIMASNMPEWTIADIAIMSIRAVTVPVYVTNSKVEVEYIINDAEIKVLFVGEQEEYNKAVEISKTSKFLKQLIVFKKEVVLNTEVNSIYFEEVLKTETDTNLETVIEQRYAACQLTDLASIIYTSGTTGEPKGVMLSHSNFAESLAAHDRELTLSDKESSLSFLPLSHIFERSWVFFCLHRAIPVYFNENPKEIAATLKEVKPTLMCTVPRLYEKIYGAIQDKKKETKGAKLKLFNWALEIGNEYYNNYQRLEINVPTGLKFKFKFADALVLKKLREIFGGNINFMPCGGAALLPELVAFFHSFGINVKCGYGLTETTATATLFGNTKFEFNSAGKPISGTQLKIGENDEIMVKGPGVMLGYYKKPNETEAVFNNGWFCTGDAGKIDKNGNLTITDRIKDLIKTSGGKYIAPQKLETAMVSDSFIEQIAIIGESRKFVTALMVPCFDCLKEYANKNKISFSSIEDLIMNNKIKELFESKFEALQKDFAGFEKIKKFTILPKEFTIDAGEITATLKLKRKEIQKKYKELIDKMYSE